MGLVMDRESLKTSFWRVISVEAEGRRPVGHAIALMWLFGGAAMLLMIFLLMNWI